MQTDLPSTKGSEAGTLSPLSKKISAHGFKNEIFCICLIMHINMERTKILDYNSFCKCNSKFKLKWIHKLYGVDLEREKWYERQCSPCIAWPQNPSLSLLITIKEIFQRTRPKKVWLGLEYIIMFSDFGCWMTICRCVSKIPYNKLIVSS